LETYHGVFLLRHRYPRGFISNSRILLLFSSSLLKLIDLCILFVFSFNFLITWIIEIWIVYFWMQDSVFTSQFRLHDFQPSRQSISFGKGFEAQTLSSFLSSKKDLLWVYLKRESFSCLFKTWPISIDDAIVLLFTFATYCKNSSQLATLAC